ncbi:MAG TPA: flavin reductase family protein [Thermoanaerobaculia bacterium]|jgi:flavin reductase (DIM6/NTAB) family NADH-FMN oxidoreductase RutF|nr:flavin reductase family protein [Thermoanaerobaculia bacterium]
MFEVDPSIGHRLLAPRIGYVIGTNGPPGPNMAPVSNLTSVSRTPQVIVVAVYKQWQTYQNLLSARGFTVSVPHVGQNDAVWKLAEKYSGFKPPNGRTKLDVCGNAIIYESSEYGPFLADAIGWLECTIIKRADIEADHGIFFAGVARAHFNERYVTEKGDHLPESKPVMQLVGNAFATSGERWTNEYF